MTRPMIALFAGLAGFAAYVALVVVLADFVLDLHWVLQLAYFLLTVLFDQAIVINIGRLIKKTR